MSSRNRTRSQGTQEIFGSTVERLPEDYLVAHIDGGARGNPGHAGYGVVIEDHAGRKLDEIAHYLGKTTNNVAEYSALVAAIEYAVSHRFKAVKILSDSELLVRQMRGEYKVRNPGLLPLYQKAKALIRELNWFEVRHVPREDNREADHLANVAMDRAYSQPHTAAAAPVPEKRASAPAEEVEGVVRDGVVRLVGCTLPEGTRVRVKVK